MRHHSSVTHHPSSGNNIGGSHGVQQLLVAEKRAAEKVAEARKRKARRIKQAREEAEAEIEIFKSQKEKQFLEYEIKYMGNSEDIAASIQQEADKQIAEHDHRVRENKDAVRTIISHLDILTTVTLNIRVSLSFQFKDYKAKLHFQY
ncbi:V-type proton ATPase subunit G-like [Diorhabda sublineata]|uniref:V-type proton ATPase subunit G-like n=1 Tax=Diorhabda sublineata TaxID=1163346 RepID=UPI0024E0D6D3|nr:V-type proton ATPase subunit G-like [Diorhabda sublineata]